MRYGFLPGLLATVTALVTAQHVHACECADEEIVLSVRAADRIFTGPPIEAEVVEPTPRTITFTVEVSDRLRGTTADRTTRHALRRSALHRQ
jgi:hypothetical protein